MTFSVTPYAAAPYSTQVDGQVAYVAAPVGPSVIGIPAGVLISSSVGPSVIASPTADQVWVPHEIRCYALPLGPSSIGPATYIRPHIATSVGPSQIGLPRSRLLPRPHAADSVGPSAIASAESEVLYNYAALPIGPSQIGVPTYLATYPHAAASVGPSRICRAEGPMPHTHLNAVSVLWRENSITVRN